MSHDEPATVEGALSDFWNEEPAVDAEVQAAYERTVSDAFRAFLVRFRRDIGRPMTGREYALAQLAHCSGFVDGADFAFGVAASEADRLAPQSSQQRDDDDAGRRR